ncbi:ribosome recycling factor [Brochothrix thermosphacta]|uniref:ribosome recycling factor n=1 Tax=Brochothrix thermosphacta TaxID=2756 RepID=UPI0039AFC93A
MTKEILNSAKERMVAAEGALSRELANIRAGRANTSILDRITVEYWGAQTPLNQLAAISVPEARVLMIAPFDKGTLSDVERAIFASDLGLTPSNDGEVIRLTIPALTEERRKVLAKQVKSEAENAKVSVRNVRRDANDDLKKAEKAGDITEDELRQLSDEVQKYTDASIKKIDSITKDKEDEIMSV